MNDPTAMTRFMHAMAEYSIRQQDRVAAGCDADTEAAVEENREATAALALLVTRRKELRSYRERVHELTEEDAERIEAIWRELARDGDGDGDDGAEGMEEGSDAQEEEAQPSGEEVEAEAETETMADDDSTRAVRIVRRDEDIQVEKAVVSADGKPSALRTLAAVEVNAMSNFGKHSGPLCKRLTTSTNGNKLHERLQRARSGGKLGGAAKGVEPFIDEIGVLVHPL